MADKALAGYETVDTFTPDQLYAGEADIVTTQGTVLAATAAMPKYQVVAKAAGGDLVPYTYANGQEPYGVLPHAVDSAVDVDTPVIIGGVLNFDVLVAGGSSYDNLRRAFASYNSNIVIQKLY